MGKILIDRIGNGIDSKLRKEQAGFRRGRGTTELNFSDFEKAFDSVHRESLLMADHEKLWNNVEYDRPGEGTI